MRFEYDEEKAVDFETHKEICKNINVRVVEEIK